MRIAMGGAELVIGEGGRVLGKLGVVGLLGISRVIIIVIKPKELSFSCGASVRVTKCGFQLGYQGLQVHKIDSVGSRIWPRTFPFSNQIPYRSLACSSSNMNFNCIVVKSFEIVESRCAWPIEVFFE